MQSDQMGRFDMCQRPSRWTLFTVKPKRVCKRKRCLGFQGECLKRVKRDMP